jgi:hypothetical protein
MNRRWRHLTLVLGLVALVAAGPAVGAQDDIQVDLMEFIPEQFRGDFEDRNGDGIPDLGSLPPEGIAGIWDDRVGAIDEEAFLDAVSSAQFDLDDGGSSLTGACKGVAISYDADGMSVDAMFNRGGDEPPLDIYGNQKMTRSNPFLVDTRGVLVYFGSTQPDTFLDHRWFLMAGGLFKDQGGDPNQQGKNRNAGSVDFGTLLPFPFTALVKAKGAWVSGWGPTELPVMDSYPEPNCVGEGWVEFVGPNPFLTLPGVLAVALAVAGFSGILFNARPALSWREG